MGKQPRFSDGKRGAALPVRVIPRASRNEIVEILNDQTVKIRLVAPPTEQETNQELIKFLSEVLGVSASKLEVVAGIKGRDKLVSILDLSSQEVHNKIISHLS
jgi:uncharacterized protein (TIGR00251 family)